MSDADVAPANSMISGATKVSRAHRLELTPVWAPDNGHVVLCIHCNSKVSQLDLAILCRENVRSFDVSVYDTLFMQIHEPKKYLVRVYCNQMLWEVPESLTDAVQ